MFETKNIMLVVVNTPRTDVQKITKKRKEEKKLKRAQAIIMLQTKA